MTVSGCSASSVSYWLCPHKSHTPSARCVSPGESSQWCTTKEPPHDPQHLLAHLKPTHWGRQQTLALGKMKCSNSMLRHKPLIFQRCIIMLVISPVYSHLMAR